MPHLCNVYMARNMFTFVMHVSEEGIVLEFPEMTSSTRRDHSLAYACKGDNINAPVFKEIQC